MNVDFIVAIERDKWLYVYTNTAEKARRFFGLPPETETRVVEVGFAAGPEKELWAIKAPI